MAARKKATVNDRTELLEALDELEKEKQISKEIIIQAIESSLLAACKDEYGKSDNIKVIFDRETGAIGVYAEMEIVEDDLLEDETTQMAFSVATATAIIAITALGTGAPPYLVFIVQIQQLNCTLNCANCQVIDIILSLHCHSFST